MKKVLYLDLDVVITDFDAEMERLNPGSFGLKDQKRRLVVHRVCSINSDSLRIFQLLRELWNPPKF